jgi:hypothetical protein
MYLKSEIAIKEYFMKKYVKEPIQHMIKIFIKLSKKSQSDYCIPLVGIL